MDEIEYPDGANLPKKLPKACTPQIWLEASIESFDPAPYRVRKTIRVRIRRLHEALYEADCPDLPFAATGKDVRDAYQAMKAVLLGLFAGKLRPDLLPDGSPSPDLSSIAEYIARKPHHDA